MVCCKLHNLFIYEVCSAEVPKKYEEELVCETMHINLQDNCVESEFRRLEMSSTRDHFNELIMENEMSPPTKGNQ